MRQYTLFLLAFMMTMLFVTACKKDKAEPASKTELLSRQPWILRAYSVVRLSDGHTEDGFAPMSPCYRDDNYVFKADHTYEGNAGPVKCSSSDPQVFQTGSWSFLNNETILERVITTGTGIGTFQLVILSLTTNELKVHVNDGTYDHIITYSH